MRDLLLPRHAGLLAPERGEVLAIGGVVTATGSEAGKARETGQRGPEVGHDDGRSRTVGHVGPGAAQAQHRTDGISLHRAILAGTMPG